MAIRPRTVAWTAFAIAMLLVTGPTTGSVAAQHPMKLDEETKALFLQITDLAVERGALSPETAASLHRLFDSDAWTSIEDARAILSQAADELASAPPIPEDDDGLQQGLDRLALLALERPRRERTPILPSAPKPDPDPDPDPTPGGGGSCQKDCKTEHNWCYAECALVYLACVAASSGWGALACFFLYLVCIAHCDEQYEICMRRCEDPDWSVATADAHRLNAFPAHDAAAVVTGVGGTQPFSSRPTLVLAR